jgi:hypothetical protein
MMQSRIHELIDLAHSNQDARCERIFNSYLRLIDDYLSGARVDFVQFERRE